MWIEERPNGKFRAVERYTDPLTGTEKRVTVTIEKNTASSRKSAEILLMEKISKKISMANVKDKKVTFSNLVDLWRDYQKQTVKQSTYRRNVFASNRLIEILGADVLVDKMTAAYVISKLMAYDNKPGTVNERLVRFKSIMRWGYKFDYVQDISWLDKLDPMKDKEKKEKLADKYLESYELKKLIDSMKNERWKNLTRFLALTGMRVGEALALTINDIDLKQRLIHVTKTFDVVNDIFTTPKTETSVRDVYITDELYPLCKSLRSEALKRRLVDRNDNMIFYQRKYDYYAYLKYFKSCVKNVLGRDLTVHSLRHTHVSLLAENGVPLDVISRRLGHNSSKVTKEVYFHVTERLKEKENEQLKNISLL